MLLANQIIYYVKLINGTEQTDTVNTFWEYFKKRVRSEHTVTLLEYKRSPVCNSINS